MKNKANATKWAAIKQAGRIVGYVLVFRMGNGQYATVPGASRFTWLDESKENV